MEIVKKGFALLCALALTLTLSPPPAQAADNLDPAAAVAFYVAAVFWADENIFVHAELRDMDGDGQPELAALTIPKELVGYWQGSSPYFFSGNCVIWKYVPGLGVRRFSATVGTGQFGDITWAYKGNAVYLHVYYARAREGYVHETHRYFGASGLAERVSWKAPITDSEEASRAGAITNRIVNGQEQPISLEEHEKIILSYQDETESLLKAENWNGSSHCVEYTALESRLYDMLKNVSAAPSATWGVCRLDTENDTWIVFEAASIERKAVSVNTVTTSLGADRESGYQNQTVTVVKARAGSHFAIFRKDDGLSHDIFYDAGTVESESRFRVFVSEFGSETLTGGLVRMKLGYKERGLVRFADRDGADCVLYADPGGALDAYTDVNPAGYYAVPVTWGIQHGITNGTTATTFSPNNTCTRAHILTFLWRVCGSPQPSIENPFTDVSATNYYYQPALWAAERGLLQSGNKFNGGSPCARSEAVRILWKLSGGDDVEGATCFKDVKNGTETAKAVQWAVESGVTNGTTATTFSPDNTCTRAQIMAFLYRDYAIET